MRKVPALFLALLPLVAAAAPLPTPSPGPGAAASYRFEAKTVWGRLKVLVGTQPGLFRVEAQGDHPLTGWSLLDETSRKTLSRKSRGPSDKAVFEVKEDFRGPYRLTVFFRDDREEVPVSLRLSAEEARPSSGEGGAPEDFKADPNRPYNVMVRSFYEKAQELYGKGQLEMADRSLLKAQELDPEQVQVLAFRSRIRKERGLPTPKAEPSPAPEGTPAPVVRKVRTRKKAAAAPAPTPTPSLSDADRSAQADQAYNLGLESYRQNDLSAAKSFWERTLAIDPTHPQAKRNLERLLKEHPDLH